MTECIIRECSYRAFPQTIASALQHILGMMEHTRDNISTE